MLGLTWKLVSILLGIALIFSPQLRSWAQTQSATRVAFDNSFKKPIAGTTNASADKNVPTVVRSQLTDAETQEIADFSIALKMRNFAELQERVGMGEIIPPEEMSKYFPASGDVEIVRRWLVARGFEVQPPAQYEISVFGRPVAACFRGDVRPCPVPWRRAQLGNKRAEFAAGHRRAGAQYQWAPAASASCSSFQSQGCRSGESDQ